MISRKWWGITFCFSCSIRGFSIGAQLKRDIRVIFLEVKKRTFLNWSKTLYLNPRTSQNVLIRKTK